MKKVSIQLDCEIPVRTTLLPLWNELAWPLEWLKLRSSLVYRGIGVPRGSGAPVLVVPGFMSSDAHLTELQHWLIRIGYRALPSGIGRNLECPDVLLEKLVESLDAAYHLAGSRVSVIGHSLGGTLARAAAVRRPDLVRQVITLASPISEIEAHPFVLTLARLSAPLLTQPAARPRRHGDHVHDGSSCSCELIHALGQAFPDSVSRSAIFTRDDGVVRWRSCLDEDARRNVDVRGSHLGLIVNEEVYMVLADLLASLNANRPDKTQGALVSCGPRPSEHAE
jgi:pimeloyl-ACP methyl ester carboxylesterase